MIITNKIKSFFIFLLSVVCKIMKKLMKGLYPYYG